MNSKYKRAATAEDAIDLSRDFIINFCKMRNKHLALDKVVSDNPDIDELSIRKQFYDCGWKEEYFCL